MLKEHWNSGKMVLSFCPTCHSKTLYELPSYLGFQVPNLKDTGDIEFKLSLLLSSRFSRVRLCVTPWTAAYQASLSMGFSRQEHWSGLPFPSPMHESGK